MPGVLKKKCCCVLPLICNDLLRDIRLRIAGVDIAKCLCSFSALLGTNAIRVTALNVDGDYVIPGDGSGIYQSSLTPGGVVTIQYFNDQICASLHSECNGNDLFIEYVVNCAFLNAQGQPRIQSIQVRAASLFECAPPTPEQNHNYVFWYLFGSCGGTYYHGDAVPNGGTDGVSCDRTAAACQPDAGMLSTGGTIQALPV